MSISHPDNRLDRRELELRVRKLEEELRRTNQHLEESLAREARYRQVTESNMVGVLFWHIDGRVTEANDKVLEITGYNRSDLLEGSVNWLSMTPPEFREREARAHRELAELGVCTPFEKEYVRKDGTRVPILVGGAFIRGSREEGVGFLLDISEKHRVEQSLEASRRLFQAFTDNSPVVAFLKDTQSRRVYVNEGYRKVFANGCELLGKSDADIYGPELAESLRQVDHEVLATKVPTQSVVSLPTPDGVTRTWLSYKFPVEDERGEMFLGGVALDITELKHTQEQLQRVNDELERRVAERTGALEQVNQDLRQQIAARERAQDELRRSETRFRKWLEQSAMPIQVVTPQGKTIQVNRAWEEYWGATLEDLATYNLLSDPQLQERGLSFYIHKALAGEAVVTPEAPYIPDRGAFQGVARWSRAVIYPVKDDLTGQVEEIVLLHDDVTARKMVEQQLQAEERLLRRLLDLHEKERKLMAYEIHDGVAQYLIGSQMLLDTYVQTRTERPDESLQKSAELLRQAITEARRLISDLRPLVIDEKGIVQALQYLIAEEEQRGGPNIHFFHRVQFDRLSPLLEGTVYRIVQEAITNARRHSGSTEIELWLHQEGGRLKVMIRDYGCGFEVDHVPEDRFGLEGIRQRAKIFGGSCTIESELHEGTTIRVELPLASS